MSVLLRQRARRLRMRLRGECHTLFVQSDRVWSWGVGGSAAAASYASVQDWCDSQPGARARLILSGQLTRQLSAAGIELPLNDPSVLASWARHQLSHYHGESAQAWPMAPWLDGRQRGVCALHAADLASWQAHARLRGVGLVSARPWWSVALRAVSAAHPDWGSSPDLGLAVVEGRQLTWVACSQGLVTEVRQRWMDSATHTALAAMVAELADTLPQGSAIAVCGHGLAPTTEPSRLRALSVGSLDGVAPPIEWMSA
jgi:hypothetical protein